MRLDELTYPGWGNTANYFRERDMMYGTAELKVPAVVKPQIDTTAATPAHTTFGQYMPTLDIVPGQSQIPAVASQPGSSQLRLGSEKPVTQIDTSSLARCGTRFNSDSWCKASWTSKLLPLQITCLVNCALEIRYGWRYGDSSRVAGGIDIQIVNFHNLSVVEAIWIPIVLCASFFLISVTKLRDMIFHQCVCKGRTGHAKILDSKSVW